MRAVLCISRTQIEVPHYTSMPQVAFVAISSDLIHLNTLSAYHFVPPNYLITQIVAFVSANRSFQPICEGHGGSSRWSLSTSTAFVLVLMTSNEADFIRAGSGGSPP